mgnify:CR=1 FL=1
MENGIKKQGAHKRLIGNVSVWLSGDVSELRGNVSGLSGNASELSGDVSGLSGDVSELNGNIDFCELSDNDRKRGIRIEALIGNGEDYEP